MSSVVRQEILFFAASVLTGVGLLLFYDVFRIFRRVVRHNTLAVSLEDFFYWCSAALIIFAMIFKENSGILRGYAFAGILIGAWLEWLVEVFFQKIWIKLLKKRKKKGKMTKETVDDK